MENQEKKVEGEVVSPSPDNVPAVKTETLPAKVDSDEITKLKLFISDETEKRKLLIEYIRSQLSDGVDYGRIHVKRDCPNKWTPELCKIGSHWSKPTLFKPGSEKICSLMKLTVKFEPDTMMVDLLGKQSMNDISIPLICKLMSSETTVVAEGRGIASVSKTSTAFDFELNKQMKIAEKRAQTDAVLRLGFSYYFTHDLEYMPEDDAPAPTKASSTSQPQKASANASQGQSSPASGSSSKMSFDVTKPLKFGKHKGKTPSDASVPPSWILFMTAKVDEKTGEALKTIAHNKCDGFIMRYCSRNNESPEVLAGELKKRFNKTTLIEMTLQEKVQFCEILEGSGK